MMALSGLRVIDLSHVMAGPACALMLADMGADVIKVEKVPGGDDTRRMVPPTVGEESAAFLMMNRGKRGMALDLRHNRGRQVLKRLLSSADVVIENYRQRTLERLEIGYERLKADNPRLIYCAISGFGRSGPYAERGGFDLVAQAMSGIMSITGTRPGEPPVKCGPPITDITAGLLATIGILAAVHHRERTGEGQMVDTSLFEAGIIQTYWHSAIALATGISPPAMGSAHPLSAPYQAVKTSDGWLVIGGANQKSWRALVEALEAPELADDPRFSENRDRMAHLKELDEVLTSLFARRSTGEWLAVLEGAGVPAGPVNDIVGMHRDPQTLARDMVVEVEHAKLGKIKTLGLPIKFSQSPGGPRRGAPVYGQHTREILREHGYAEAEIESLLESGAAVATEAAARA